MRRIALFITLFTACLQLMSKNASDVQTFTKATLLTTNTGLGATSPKYAEVSSTVTNPAARTFGIASTFATVQLYYPSSATNRPTGGTGTVSLNITYWTETAGALQPHTQTNQLKIDLTPGSYKPATIRLENALKVSATLAQAAQIDAALTDIKLEFRVVTEYFDLLSAADGVANVRNSTTKVSTDGRLQVLWDAQAKAESYELEWTYVSNQDPKGYDATNQVNRLLTPAQITLRDQLFRNNSSRVEVKGTQYDIPLVYERGYIIYRVRPIGRNISQNVLYPIKGAWSLEDNYTNLGSVPASHYYLWDGLEENLNWQSSLSFAEEGKNKSVLSYHDGSSRNRQAVTIINTDERSVVGETMYDYNGRPQIQVLPVPTVENNLYYYPNFNTIGGDIKKDSYDKAVQGNSCNPTAPVFDINSVGGAAKYYSSSNPFSTGGNTKDKMLNRDLLPDAKGFPYTQTKYMSDNTGRVAAQSGVGENHLIGSNKDTRYLYGVPDQSELVRLFGTEVGLAAHYKKNAVIDPNGQVSVSYLDMDGKVIATALAGGNPNTLTPLTGDKARQVLEEQVLTDANNKPEEFNTKKTYTKKFTIAENNTKYTIDYEFKAAPYVITCKNNADNSNIDLNLSAVLDVNLDVKSCAGSVLATPYNYSTTYQFGNGTLQTDHSFVKELNLAIGDYELTKTLKINEQKLSDYLSAYIENPNYTCLIPINQYVKDSIINSSIAGCDYNCQTCSTDVQAAITALTNQGKTPSDYDKEMLYSKCYDLCRSNVTCVSRLTLMTADLSPGGQYAQLRDNEIKDKDARSLDETNLQNPVLVESDYDVQLNSGPDGDPLGEPNNDIQVEKFPLSIFNPNHSLRRIQQLPSTTTYLTPDWHRPLRVSFSSISGSNTEASHNKILFKNGLKINNLNEVVYTETNYYDVKGNLVYVTLIKAADGSYSPEILSDAGAQVIKSANTYRILLKYLKNVADIEKNWQPHFANYLLPYHPEFPYFLECILQEDLHDYESKMHELSSAGEDLSHKYVATNGTVKVLDEDPFFAKYANLKADFQKRFNNYKVLPNGAAISMVQAANLADICPVNTLNCPNGANCPTNSLGMTDKAAWATFRSLYLMERNKELKKMATANAIAGKYFNGCIGDPDFASNRSNDNAPFFANKQISFFVQTCNSGIFSYFRKRCTNTNLNFNFFNGLRSSYFDAGQNCYIQKDQDFGDKIRLFYPDNKVAGNYTLPEARCTQTITDGSTTTEVEVNCEQDEIDFINNQVSLAQRRRYSECGLCPIASDLQDFLISLQRTKHMTGANFVTSKCPPSQSPAGIVMGTELSYQFGRSRLANPISAQDIVWTGNYNTTTKTLTGTLSNATKNLGITLNFSQGSTPFPAGIAVDFTKLKICCLAVLSATTFELTVYYNGVYDTRNNERYESIDLVRPSDHIHLKESKFVIKGTISGTTLTPCTLKPNCVAITNAKNVVGLLNMLCLKSGGSTENMNKPAMLVAPTVSALTSEYEVPVRRLLSVNELKENVNYTDPIADPLKYAFTTIAPTWTSTVANGPTPQLSGTLHYSLGPNININIVNTSGGINFGEIDYFTNVRPTEMTAAEFGATEKIKKKDYFLANAVKYDPATNKKIFYTVTIQVVGYDMTLCQK